MKKRGRGVPDGVKPSRYYHGTRREWGHGDQIEPGSSQHGVDGIVYLTANLDEAIWDAEIAGGEGPGRVYIVEPIGEIEQVRTLPDWSPPSHPSMSCFSREPLCVTGEVTEWLLYHGTRAALRPGDLIEAGHRANFGDTARIANYVYLARTLDAAIWGAELARGDGLERIYIVEPTGPIEDDPNLTDMKFRGNPTKSFRSREPVRIVGEIAEWQGHAPDVLQAMKDGIARMERLGNLPIDD